MALLANLLARGIELQTDGARVRWRPAFLVKAAEAELIRSHKAELVALLQTPDRLPRCPACGRPLDAAGRCPKCFDRRCVACGRLTGSYFLMHCVFCSHAFIETGNDSAETQPY
jgi:tRNA(Ile2) C34 agmatinyltransferase TiaS